MARSVHGPMTYVIMAVAGKLRGERPPSQRAARPAGRASGGAATLEGALERALLSGGRVRIRGVVVAGQDAHVVFRGEPEDEPRLHAVPSVRVAGIGGIGRGALARIGTFRGAELGGT